MNSQQNMFFGQQQGDEMASDPPPPPPHERAGIVVDLTFFLRIQRAMTVNGLYRTIKDDDDRQVGPLIVNL